MPKTNLPRRDEDTKGESLLRAFVNQNAPFLAWSLAAAALALAAFCLASLTWDGSYYLFRSIQDGVPMLPNHRWMNALLLGPVVWARPLANDPAQLAVLHGLLCALLPLGSLAICLRMLRGAFAPLRFWAVLGILLAPLPGQMVFAAEATTALQWSWVCLAFVWRGCPGRWVPVALVAVAVMWGLHPLAAPLFGLVAVTAGALGLAAREKRRRFWGWAAFFALAAGGKMAETLAFATAYEKANLHGSAWLAETTTALLMTPLIALLPVFADAGRSAYQAWRAPAAGASATTSRSSHLLWGIAFGLGVIYSLAPGGWGGALCYRKFGLLLAVPTALLAGAEAGRFWRGGARPGTLPAGNERSLLRPALLFAVILSGMALSWRTTCGSLRTRLAAHSERVELLAELPQADRSRGLDHWSTTALSLMLQGWSPAKVHVWNAALQQGPGGFCICPGDPMVWKDGVFKLAWVARLRVSGAATTEAPATTPR